MVNKVFIDPLQDKALVINDDGLMDSSDYAPERRLIVEEGDRSERDYADYSEETADVA